MCISNEWYKNSVLNGEKESLSNILESFVYCEIFAWMDVKQ